MKKKLSQKKYMPKLMVKNGRRSQSYVIFAFHVLKFKKKKKFRPKKI